MNEVTDVIIMDILKFLLHFILIHFKIIQNLRIERSSTIFPMKDYILTSTRIQNFNITLSRSKRFLTECVFIDLKTSNESYKLCLQIKNHSESIIGKSAKFFMYKNITTIENFQLPPSEMLFIKGYVTTEPYSSFVNGYVKNTEFYGRVFVNNRIYYVEDVKSFRNILNTQISKENAQNAIVYEGSESNLIINIQFHDDSFKAYKFLKLPKIQDLIKKKLKSYKG